MDDMGWREAAVKVLAEASKPLHYTDIAQRILSAKLKTKVGATPAASLLAAISISVNKDGVRCPFLKTGSGQYTLRQASGVPAPATPIPPEEGEEAGDTGFIAAFGMYWRREDVDWGARPKLWGRWVRGGNEVDFSEQQGVYLLHDGNRVVYVGKAGKQRLGSRLFEHTLDRHRGRWDRFSWFGIRKVMENGHLGEPPQRVGAENLIAAMEALLIEGLEPPRNRRGGDNMEAEFIQVQDPRLERDRLLEKLGEKLKKAP